jgi:hypothetical protein
VERFWRNLIAGTASCRFHRPPAGIGLNDTAKACIQAARKAESRIELWDVKSRMDLLGDRQEDEAYLAARPGEKYLLYFTDGGSVDLDLSKYDYRFSLQWISIATGQWAGKANIAGGKKVTIKAPGKMGWAAVVVKQ